MGHVATPCIASLPHAVLQLQVRNWSRSVTRSQRVTMRIRTNSKRIDFFAGKLLHPSKRCGRRCVESKHLCISSE